MKTIDPKSYIIGVLCAALFLTLTGAKKQSDNLGDILVNSITVADDGLGLGGWIAVTDTSGNEAIVIGLDEDGGKVQVNNHDGKLIAFLASDDNGSGHLLTYDDDGRESAFVGTSVTGSGSVRTYSSTGKETTYLGTGMDGIGFLTTSNKDGVTTGYFGTNNKQNGMIIISDGGGKTRWGMDSGESKSSKE